MKFMFAERIYVSLGLWLLSWILEFRSYYLRWWRFVLKLIVGGVLEVTVGDHVTAFSVFVCKDCNTVEDMQRVKCETKCFIEEFVNGTVNRGCLDGSPTSECDANLGKYGTKQCCRSDDCNASTNLRVAVSSVASVLLTVKIFQIFLQ